MSKRVLRPSHIIKSASMTSNVTSPVTDIRYFDNVSVQIQFSGSPVGSFAIQTSLDYNPGDAESGGMAAAGTWTPLVINGSSSFATSLGSPMVFDLNQLSMPYLRTVYTASSSTGTLDIYVAGKEV